MGRFAALLFTLFLLCSCLQEEEGGDTIGSTASAVSNSNLAISAGSTNFGNVPVGSSATLTFILTNTHNGQNLTNVGPGSPAFAAPFNYAGGSYPGTGGTCTSVVNRKDGTCTVVVQFQPTSAGNFSGVLAIQSQTGGGGTVYTNLVSIGGTGTQTPAALSLLDTFPYDFQQRATGSSTSKTFTLRNTGQATATLSITTAPTAPFSFLGGNFPGTGGTCSTTLAGNSNCTFVMSFSPTAAGNFSTSARIQAGTSQANFTLLGSGAAPQAPGSTDTSFGTGGMATTNSGGPSALMTSMKIYSNEKIFSGGFTFTGTSNDFMASVYTLSGAADTSFNTTGFNVVDLGGNDVVQSAIPLSDGKILLAGYSDNRFAIVRLNANGSLDTTFNGNGKQVLGWGDSFAYEATVDSNENPILVGTTNSNGHYQMAIVRLTSAGALDTTFNGTGKVFLSVGLDNAMAFTTSVQSDGKILVAGYAKEISTYDMVVVRLLADGSLDTSFSGDGIQFINFDGHEKATSVFAQSDGKIIVAGRSTTLASPNPISIAVARLNADGSLDATFATGGKYKTTATAAETANAVAVQSGSDYYIAWTRYRQSNPAQNTVKVTKLNTSGQAVTTFGNSGTLNITSLSCKRDQNPAIAVLSDGRVVVGSTTVNGSDIASSRIW